MPSPFSEFYSGSMLAPDRVGNTLQQSKIFSGPSSVAQMYAGIIPPNGGGMSPVGEGLTALGGWNQFDDQFNAPAPAPTMVASAIPHANGSIASGKTQERLPSGNVLAFGAPAGPVSPGVAAIDHATSLAQMFGSAFGGGWGSPGLSGGLDFSGSSNNFTGVPGEGDPWSGLRLGDTATPTPGLATGSGGGPSTVAQMYAPPTLNVTKNINRFLSEQGQNTAGMTAGEQANAFRKSMGFGP